MKITALRTLVGHYGRVEAGEEFDPGPATAKALIAKGVAVAKSAPVPRNKMSREAENKGVERPLAGSPTGAVATASSSGQARAPKTRRSTARGTASKS